MQRRIRINRQSLEDTASAKKKSGPKFSAYDYVRFSEDEVSGQSILDVYAVIRVIPVERIRTHEGVEEKVEEVDYLLRSLVTGREVTLPECLIQAAEEKYLRYVVRYYRAVVVSLESIAGLEEYPDSWYAPPVGDSGEEYEDVEEVDEEFHSVGDDVPVDGSVELHELVDGAMRHISLARLREERLRAVLGTQTGRVSGTNTSEAAPPYPAGEERDETLVEPTRRRRYRG